MSVSVFDIYTVGIGPSSSHTVGPMKAAKSFIDFITGIHRFSDIHIIKCDFYGSLALTGKGHGTDKACILGLQGFEPETINSDAIDSILENVKSSKKLNMNFDGQNKIIDFHFQKDIKFHRRVSLPHHPNGMAFAAFDENHKEIIRKIYYSIGGGFILEEAEIDTSSVIDSHLQQIKFPYSSAANLLKQCEENKLNISDIVYENELTWRSKEQIAQDLLHYWKVMQDCVKRGFKNTGTLPGGLKVARRAPKVYRLLTQNPEKNLTDTLSVLDWVNLYALAVNEENAAGGQVVTAPTNGAAGIIPAVLHYYTNFCPQSSVLGIQKFLLTAGAIAILYKKNASISGAEVGCQGEVGVACSMAAGALCEVLGGNPSQVENAAEIAMEHNLGLTCDPIGGLVQIPCIERNAMGAIKAINAARMALRGDGSHFVSLDKVIATMKQTGKDMKKQYKETSRGGLAVNITEC
ncbi:MAG: L-serine ammonia-lyase [Halobacteriovoraceae bacterium]|nr:L-serine ammonia-lyase [Halobacteriovoraceae bacterium]MAX66385.1 L-serine ammonia-lyase [Halobacteriovoraceae bacterium]